MSQLSTDILICGAGMAGISTAYALAVTHNLHNVLLVDPEPLLSVTSDKSFEGYRNWYPGPGDAMVALSNRSIDILEEIQQQFPHLSDKTAFVLHARRCGWFAGRQYGMFMLDELRKRGVREAYRSYD